MTREIIKIEFTSFQDEEIVELMRAVGLAAKYEDFRAIRDC